MSTEDYKRGYRKGYNTGKKLADEALAREIERATQAAQRAERAEKVQGVGHCCECKYWRQGGGHPSWSSCAWGICEAPAAAGSPWGTYACSESHLKCEHRIQTTPHFGCVVFMKRAAATAEPSDATAVSNSEQNLRSTK